MTHACGLLVSSAGEGLSGRDVRFPVQTAPRTREAGAGPWCGMTGSDLSFRAFALGVEEVGSELLLEASISKVKTAVVRAQGNRECINIKFKNRPTDRRHLETEVGTVIMSGEVDPGGRGGVSGLGHGSTPGLDGGYVVLT